MAFNTSAPTTLGLEWAPTVESVTPLTSTTDCVAWKVASTATETISTIYLPHTWSGPSTGYGKLIVDVYNIADTGAGSSPTTTRYAPNATQSNNNLYAPYPWASVTTTAHTYVDDGSSYNDSDYLAFANTSKARFEFGTTAFTGAVQYVTFEIRAMGYAGGTPRAKVDLYYNGSRVSTLGTLAPPADSDDIGNNYPNFRTYTIGPFATNPRTGVAWTQSDITSFDTSGSGHALQIELVSGLVGVSWISMIVASGTDKRVATGSTATQTSLPSGTQTNLPVTLASNWSKTNGTTYLLVARRADDPTGAATALVPQPFYLDGAVCPHGQGVSYSTTIDSGGFVSAVGDPDTNRTVPFWLGTSGGAQSADSQPYFDIDAVQCTTSNNVYQDLTGATNVPAYKLVTAIIGVDPTAEPTASATVVLKRTSDNVQLGGSATLAVADLDDADTATYLGTLTLSGRTVDIYRAQVLLSSSATLAAATEYYTQWTSSTATTNPWYFLWLVGTASHSLTGDTTYGGSGVVGWNGGASYEANTHMQTVGSVPTAPSSITVTKTTTTINGVSIDYAAISWVNGAALGSAFERWDVDRSEDAGTTWDRIATISTEATLTFDDYESSRDTAVKYRVRQVRTDLAPSDWTTQSGTITPAAASGAWAVFTTNADPAVTVGYNPHGSVASVDFLSAEEVTYVRLHDQDYTAAFRPLEERGIRWPFTLQVHTSQSTPSSGAGVQVFDLLRACANASGSVCLHTADGERFFGSLVVSRGMRDFATGAYMAECVFTQTGATASTVAL